ncbi:hypothetical protein BDN72DRAFT_100938 [Pluteus cervinus]|uniref:Uncharacterized protein n=1 Tax=Pluteus cervinus TaxID=181527 RepID=A0ACD3B7Y1_9AGAR|nr:hypothetical protein BDN72DRAFT_100938 [Pluteus cervinus]
METWERHFPTYLVLQVPPGKLCSALETPLPRIEGFTHSRSAPESQQNFQWWAADTIDDHWFGFQSSASYVGYSEGVFPQAYNTHLEAFHDGDDLLNWSTSTLQITTNRMFGPIKRLVFQIWLLKTVFYHSCSAAVVLLLPSRPAAGSQLCRC